MYIRSGIFTKAIVLWHRNPRKPRYRSNINIIWYYASSGVLLCTQNLESWPIFVTEMELVYCMVQVQSVNMYNLSYFRRQLTADARVRSQVSSCETHGGQSGTGMGFFRKLMFFLSISFHPCSILLIYILFLLVGQTGKAWEPSKKQYSFRNTGAQDREEFFTFFLVFKRLVALRRYTAAVLTANRSGLWTDW
jgi:hypothetical protein